MKTIAGQIEKMFTEITFAEEREMAPLKNKPGRLVEWSDNLFTAITFAEAGEPDAARDFMGGDSGGSRHHTDSCPAGFCASRA